MCRTTREAYTHCQQKGLQRVPGFRWRLVETADARIAKEAAAIRADAGQMAVVRRVVDLLLDVAPIDTVGL